MNFNSLIGLAEYRSKNYWKFSPWGFAMNGQTSRLEATRQIIYALKVERIVETGTFRATTTEWFSQFGLPVETVELKDRYFAFSRARLARFHNTTINQNTSISYLKERAASDRVPRKSVQLFYLDAHWKDYLPLRDELELIFSHYTNAIVLIDDFKVVDDLGYGYDDYGPGKALNLEYLAGCRLPPISLFYPATPSHEETGSRRGWAVLSSNKDLDPVLESISLLRKFPFALDKPAYEIRQTGT